MGIHIRMLASIKGSKARVVKNAIKFPFFMNKRILPPVSFFNGGSHGDGKKVMGKKVNGQKVMD